MERHYCTYIMASLSRKVYVGVTNNLVRRTVEHKRATLPGFTQRYRINRLVYLETFQYVRDAIAREKQIKGWRRSMKVALIEALEPDVGGHLGGVGAGGKQERADPSPKIGLGMTGFGLLC
jgi:putative endonuclease